MCTVPTSSPFTPSQQTASVRVRSPGLGAGTIVRDDRRGRVLPLLLQREFLLRGFTGCWEQREQEIGQEGRAVLGTPVPSRISHQAAGVTSGGLKRAQQVPCTRICPEDLRMLAAVALGRCLVEGIFSMHLEVKEKKKKHIVEKTD